MSNRWKAYMTWTTTALGLACNLLSGLSKLLLVENGGEVARNRKLNGLIANDILKFLDPNVQC